MLLMFVLLPLPWHSIWICRYVSFVEALKRLKPKTKQNQTTKEALPDFKMIFFSPFISNNFFLLLVFCIANSSNSFGMSKCEWVSIFYFVLEYANSFAALKPWLCSFSSSQYKSKGFPNQAVFQSAMSKIFAGGCSSFALISDCRESFYSLDQEVFNRIYTLNFIYKIFLFKFFYIETNFKETFLLVRILFLLFSFLNSWNDLKFCLPLLFDSFINQQCWGYRSVYIYMDFTFIWPLWPHDVQTFALKMNKSEMEWTAKPKAKSWKIKKVAELKLCHKMPRYSYNFLYPPDFKF